MACSTVRSVLVDKATVTPIATISRLIPKQTSQATSTIPRLLIPTSTSSSSESLFATSSSSTPQPDDLRAPPAFSSVSGTTAATTPTTTATPISANASTKTVPIAPRPRFIPRNRRSLTSSGGDSSNWAILFPGTTTCFFYCPAQPSPGIELWLFYVDSLFVHSSRSFTRKFQAIAK
ncbi:hypothetical protein BKA57DRAFT_305048 [Linnemannia elongata]|nr:hypothetical protein BKA57DRAFT_305048 [Linnemannia elongata]